MTHGYSDALSQRDEHDGQLDDPNLAHMPNSARDRVSKYLPPKTTQEELHDMMGEFHNGDLRRH